MDEYLREAEAAVYKYIGHPVILTVLGNGVDGWVFSLKGMRAFKVLKYDEHFDREYAAYERLLELGIRKVCGFAVPRMEGADRSLRLIELSIVTPPFLLDFAGARVDEPVDFDDEVMDQKWADLGEIFGERISVVRDVYWELSEKYGIYYYDFTLKNLNFGD